MLEAAFAGLFGLLIGSFLNVCIYRMPRDLSVVRPRSFCPRCEKQIAWFDNVPVLTYFVLGGRCRHCGATIPWRYPVVESMTGLLFFIGVLGLGPTAAAIKFCVFAAMMIVLIFTDLEERILPDEFTLGGALAGIVFAAFVPLGFSIFDLFLPDTWGTRARSIAESALAAVFLSGMLWLLAAVYARVRHREGMGFGDIKMAACIGAFLGIGSALLALVAGSLLGSITGAFYIWLSRKEMASYQLPFGSFLAIAALAVALRAGPLASWLGPM